MNSRFGTKGVSSIPDFGFLGRQDQACTTAKRMLDLIRDFTALEILSGMPYQRAEFLRNRATIYQATGVPRYCVVVGRSGCPEGDRHKHPLLAER